MQVNNKSLSTFPLPFTILGAQTHTAGVQAEGERPRPTGNRPHVTPRYPRRWLAAGQGLSVTGLNLLLVRVGCFLPTTHPRASCIGTGRAQHMGQDRLTA